MLSIDRRLLKLAELSDLPEGASEKQWDALRRLRQLECDLCAIDKVYWFNTWAWTYNPKLVGRNDPWLPFDLFPRQVELVHWLQARSDHNEDGHCVKSRDIGFTWVCGGFALNNWLFVDRYKANFGSRKAEYVDKIGDPDSIFEKVRLLLRGLPHWMRPPSNKVSDNHMLLVNHDRGSIIRGESGDDMGRGGRSKDAFYDEFAFVQQQDSVDASSSANSDCRIFGSTVNGQNNLFYTMQTGDRFRDDQKFRFHWTDDPRKATGTVTLPDGTVESWEKNTRRRMEPWKFGSEYDCDFSASVEGICIPARWVESAKKLRTLVHYEPPRRGVAGGDVGGDGSAKSVAVARFGALVVPPRAWTHGDTIQTASDMLAYCKEIDLPKRKDGYKCEVTALNYDSVGVGKGTQDALKRHKTKIVTRGVNTGLPPTEDLWPDGETSQQKFFNLKAELWWKTRARFKKSHEKVLFLEGDREEGVDHPIDECIIMPSDKSPESVKLASQLSQVKVDTDAESGKIVIQSKKSLKKDKVPSPDHADALVLTEAKTSDVETWMRAFGVATR